MSRRKLLGHHAHHSIRTSGVVGNCSLHWIITILLLLVSVRPAFHTHKGIQDLRSLSQRFSPPSSSSSNFSRRRPSTDRLNHRIAHIPCRISPAVRCHTSSYSPSPMHNLHDTCSPLPSPPSSSRPRGTRSCLPVHPSILPYDFKLTGFPSLPIPTRLSMSQSYLYLSHLALPCLLTVAQGILLQGSSHCWKLPAPTSNRQRLFWEGLLGYSQAHKWLKGPPHSIRCPLLCFFPAMADPALP